jgi:hypothetical protein
MDIGRGIALDGTGNAYLTGITVSPDFPTTAGAFSQQCTTTDGSGIVRADVFVTKLNASGSALVYSTCLGGAADDEGYAIAVDGQGKAYVSGGTNSPDFPVTIGAFQTTFAGGDIFSSAYKDAFVTEVNASGSVLVYSTYLGGCGNDQANGVAVDAAGNVYVTGETKSTTCLSANFPTTPGSFQSKSTERGPFGDAFVTKLNPSGSALGFSTFLGGNIEDSGSGIAIDSAGHAFVGGSTQSATFPSTAGAFQSQDPNPIGTKGFVTKLSADGTALVYSTFLGGEFMDNISGIALDAVGNSYVTGTTYSGNFPLVNPFPQPCVTSSTGSGKVFISKLNAAGSALMYSVCVGAHGDTGNGIAVDGANNTYVAGTTFNGSFVTTPGAFQTNLKGTTDAFAVRVTDISSLSPAAINFGSEPLNVTSTAQSTTLTNDSVSPITIGTVQLSGANRADFQTPTNSCAGTVLTPGSTCTVGASFTPSALGNRIATLIITDDAADSPLSVGLAGTGVDFSVTATPATITISAGQSAAYTVTVSPQGGTFSTSISLNCGLPAGLTSASCSLLPNSVTPGSGTGTSMLTIKTSGPSAGAMLVPRSILASLVAGQTIILAGIFLPGRGTRKRRVSSEIVSLFLLIWLMQLLGCGGGSTTQTQHGTPSGTYTITLSGTVGSLQHSGTVTLVVQ